MENAQVPREKDPQEKKHPPVSFEKGKLRYTKEAERRFFFCATVAALLVWAVLKIIG